MGIKLDRIQNVSTERYNFKIRKEDKRWYTDAQVKGDGDKWMIGWNTSTSCKKAKEAIQKLYGSN